MKSEEIINHFGYSELSPEIKQLFSNLHIPLQQPEMLICWRNYKSKEWDLELVFKAKNNYYSDYGAYKKSYTDSSEEAFWKR